MFNDRPDDARCLPPEAFPVVEAIVASTVTVFEELCQTAVSPGEPCPSRRTPGPDEITAHITLRRAIPGWLSLAFPRPVLAVLAGRYLPGEAITAEIADDVAGEFANVIAGQAKTTLKGTPYHFHLSTPRVGPHVYDSDSESIAMPFKSDAGVFVIRVQLPACDEMLAPSEY
ncbi:MAG: chemotaxis protein CheX [Gemmataceae bacterium]